MIEKKNVQLKEKSKLKSKSELSQKKIKPKNGLVFYKTKIQTKYYKEKNKYSMLNLSCILIKKNEINKNEVSYHGKFKLKKRIQQKGCHLLF